MRKRNKASVPTEEMEFTFLPENTDEAPGIPEEATIEADAAEIPAEIPADEVLPEAEEAQPAEASAEPPKPEKKEKGILGICLPLIIICIGVALMLSVVNALTKDTIAAQAAAEKENAVIAIFPDATAAQLYETTEDGEIYLAIRDENLLGCCISLASGGFGGDISLMVGRTAAGEICGVQIISMSESPGIGTKTKNEAFLSQFRGGDAFVIGENADAIAGATVSSRAVIDGVNRALEMPLDFPAIASAHGLTVAADTGTDIPAVTAPAETTAPETLPSEETTAPAEETKESGEETESTSSILAMPSVTPAAAVNRVILVSTTLVTEVETEEPAETEEEPAETEPPAETEDTSEESEETETDAQTDDSAEPEETPETTLPDETEASAETTGPAESEDAAGITVPTEDSADTDTSTETDPVEPAVTEIASDAAAA